MDFTIDEEITTYPFLEDGGEMGALTRAYNWAETPIGSPDTWPVSLRVTIAMILSSKFPMFLWWGDDLIQFYNDAYRPSLGDDGKHPTALGQKGKDCWPEIWHIIFPLIEQVVTTGKATWNEDQLIPIYRNGQLEEVYWTFGYSAIKDEVGNIEGVLVVCHETTEKVKATKRLEISEKRFQNLIREATVGIIVLMGEEMRVAIVNAGYGKLVNKSVEELQNKPLFDIIPETEPYFRHILDSVRITGEPLYLYDYPYYILVEDAKKEGYLNIVYRPYKEDDGTITGVMVLCQEVTEQVESRKKLEQSEQRLRSLITAAPVAIGLFVGRDLIVEMPNQPFIDIVGKGPDIEGKPLREAMPELITENQPYLQILDNVFTTGVEFKTLASQVRITRNGILHNDYYNFTYTPLFDSEGEVYAILDIAIDVTEQVRAREKLAQSEENLRNTIEKAPVAMCIFRGPDHVVEIANDRMIEFWGKLPDDVINKPIFEGLPEAKDQGFEELLNGVYNTGEAFVAQSVPVTLPRKGTIEKVYVNFVYEAYYNGEGAIIGIIAVANEVTDQVLAQRKIEEMVTDRTKELAAANNELHRSNSELAQFAYIASHDLQEPLRKVSTFTQMLENTLGDNISDRAKSYINKINTSAERMTDLVRDVLSYSQLSKEAEKYASVDLQRVIAAIVTDFELLIEQKKAIINVGELPTIEGIPLHMSQLFGNLISNALKFTMPGKHPVITITAKLLAPDEARSLHLPLNTDYYQITVADNGIGFDNEHAGQIFHIFQRLHGRSSFTGTGIGLAICKKIAQNHQGQISATGKADEGATFNVILPVSQGK